jgi:hypothetical protein
MVVAQPTKRKQPAPAPAWRLYQGSQQQLVQQGLEAVWERYGFRQMIDEVIISPWHGPLEPDQVIAPYDFTWKGRPRAEVADIVAKMATVDRLREAVLGYDLVLVLLSKTYLAPLRMPEWVPATAPQRWLFYASGEGLPFVPASPNARVVPAGMPEARREGVKVLDLKAHLFRRLCLQVAAEGEGALTAAWQATHEIRHRGI